MKINIFTDRKGMTLIEVVVSIFLIASVVASLAAAVTQSTVFSRRIDATYTATYLAQRRADIIKRLDFDQIPSAVEEDIRIDADGNISSTGNYLRTTEITEDYDGNPYLTKVKIMVQKIKINIDGSILDSEGKMTFLADPVIMETLFSNVE